VILGQIDRVMINTFVGASETGVYSFSYTIGSIVGILIIALNRAWIPYFYEHRSSLIKLSSTIKKTSAFLIIISTILSAFSPIILVHFVSDDYAAALNIIPIIVLSNMFIYFYILYSNYFFYEKKTYLVSINTVTASVLNILLNYFLLPRFGYQIASYTTLVSYLFLFILHYYTVKLTLNYASISIRTIGLPILLVCINTAIVMLLHQSNLNDISQSLIFSVIIGFDVLLFLNNWITVEVPEEKN
jgi:O-antigen/teichoic acid export membrane protein